MSRSNDEKNDKNEKSSSSFGGGRSGYESFGGYMRHKMDLQRKQFGLRLPPPPDPEYPPLSDTNPIADPSSSSGLLDIVDRLKRRHNKADVVRGVGVVAPRNDGGRLEPHRPVRGEAHRPDLILHPLTFHLNGLISRGGLDDVRLQRLIHRRGGDVSKYITDRVDFIIAEALSTAKVRIYQRSKKPVPIVYPDWIAECDRREERVDWRPYLIDELRGVRLGGIMQEGCLWKFMATDSASNNPAQKERKANKKDGTIARESSRKPKVSESKNDETAAHRSNVRPNRVYKKKITSLEKPVLSNNKHPEKKNEQNDRGTSPIKKNTSCEQDSHAKKWGGDELEKQKKFAATKNKYPEKKNEQNDRGTLSSKTQDSRAKKWADDGREKQKQYATRADRPPPVPSNRNRNFGNDPNFLSEYFANSRLSFIGRHRARQGAALEPPPPAAIPAGGRGAVVLHVDMDCFFAAVALRKYPQYRYRPVAVGSVLGPTHVSSLSASSTGELSTCNYTARRRGVKKGMWISAAAALCPELVILPYDYPGYTEVSERVEEVLYDVADRMDGVVEPVSCDESYLSVPLRTGDDCADKESARELAEEIRRRISAGTNGCTASVGAGPNKFLARIATDAVKPDGWKVFLERADWEGRLAGMRLQDLPGCGRAMTKKLAERGMMSVRDVWDLGGSVGEEVLREVLGPGNGTKFFSFCHGRDDREVAVAPRKTIGAECNYGVRFDGPYGVDCMISGLSEEVEKRMVDADVKGTRITLKVMQRKEGVQTVKYNGHGPCNNLSKTQTVPGSVPTRNAPAIASVAWALFLEFNIHKDEIRGMGIVVSNLDVLGCENGSSSTEAKGMATWLQKGISSPVENFEGDNDEKSRGDGADERKDNSFEVLHVSPYTSAASETTSTATNQLRDHAPLHNLKTPKMKGSGNNSAIDILSEDAPSRTAKLLRMSQIDMEVMRCLPLDIQRELEQEIKKKDDDKIEERSIDLTDDIDNEHEHHCGYDREVMRSLPTSIRLELEQEQRNKNETEKYGNNLIFDLTDDSGDDERASVSSRDRRSQRQALYATRSTSFEENPSHDNQATAKKAKTTGTRKLDRNQPSMTQMMKLATVKSGRDQMRDKFSGDAVSLTELDSLPLRMQIQITNGLREGTSPRGKPTNHNDGGRKKNDTEPINISHPSQNNNFAAPSTPSNNDRGDDEQSTNQDYVPQHPEEFYSIDHTSLQNDILPLVHYLDETQNPEEDDVSHVCQFLRICIDEQRMCTVSTLLRAIRQRKDVWGCSTSSNNVSDGGIYWHILKEVEDYYWYKARKYLDTQI